MFCLGGVIYRHYSKYSLPASTPTEKYQFQLLKCTSDCLVLLSHEWCNGLTVSTNLVCNGPTVSPNLVYNDLTVSPSFSAMV